jgi:hypothetical protein
MRASGFTRTQIMVFFLLSRGLASASDCDAILQQGIRNTFQEVRTGDFRTAFQSAYCNKASADTGSSSGTSAGGSYAGYGLNFGSNSSDTSQSRAENCGSNASSLSDDKYLKAMQSVADKNIVDAWSTCKSTTFGVMINGELNGNDLLITYIFRSAGAVNQAIVDGNPSISGAKCDNAVRDQTVINTGGRIQTCTRTGDGPVSIAINTNFQPARFFIPAVVKPVSGQPGSGLSDFCKNWKGPGIPTQCLGNRFLPGVGVAPEGYTWCVLDRKFSADPAVQTYCYAREQSGSCHCAKVPPGYPQPSMDASGYVFQPR